MFGKKHIIAIVSHSILENSARSLICAPLNLAITMPHVLRSQKVPEIHMNALVLQNFQVFFFLSMYNCYIYIYIHSLMHNNAVSTLLTMFLHSLIVHWPYHTCTVLFTYSFLYDYVVVHWLHLCVHCEERINKSSSCFFPTYEQDIGKDLCM